MPQPDPKQPPAQREGDRPPLQGDYYTGGGQPLQRGDDDRSPGVDDRDAHEPGWTDGRGDGAAAGGETSRAEGAATTRSADVAKPR